MRDVLLSPGGRMGKAYQCAADLHSSGTIIGGLVTIISEGLHQPGSAPAG